MSAVVSHTRESLKLHALVMRSYAMTTYGMPYHTKERLLSIAERYDTMAESVKDDDNISVDIFDKADLPTIEELVSSTTTYPKIMLVWQLELLDEDDNPVSGSLVADTILWDFYTTLTKRYPDLPHGVIDWAAHAMPGDYAVFYRKDFNRKYRASLKEV